MANVDQPSGLTPIGTQSGADFHGKLRRVEFAVGDATACFVGDVVRLTGTNNAAGTIPVVAQSTTAQDSVGVLVSLDADFANESFQTPLTRAASTARTGLVAMGSDVLYVAQEDSDGGSIAAASGGLNINVAIGTGSDVTGSAMELDSSSAADTVGHMLRLHHIYDAPDNALGTNARWVVSINDHQDTAVVQTGI